MSQDSQARTALAPTAASDIAVLRWLVAATFIVILNETIMVNALPRLQVEFGVTERASQWLTTSFLQARSSRSTRGLPAGEAQSRAASPGDASRPGRARR